MDLTPDKESGHNVCSLSITSALVSAVLEWMVMFMIFVDASFSYLVTRFARYCQLQVPCLLCSRLDHVLGNERESFYGDLICHKHKFNISSLVFCQLHNNLVDVHGTCESCFFSFATINKSNAETYRLLVGKLGAEPYDGLAEGDEHKIASSGTRKCVCCNEKWVSRTCTQELFHSKSVDSVGAEHGSPSSFTPEFNGNKVHEFTERSSQSGQMQNKDPHLLPHVEYTKIKVTSDTESESPISDTESDRALISKMETSGQDLDTKLLSPEPQIITTADFLALEKLVQLAPVNSSLSESEDLTNSHQAVEFEAPLAHGLEELKWQKEDHENDVSEPSELIYFSKAFPSPDLHGTQYDESKATNAKSTYESEKEAHVESGEATNLERDRSGLRNEVIMECGETSTVGNESFPANDIQMDSKPDKINTSLQMAESLDLGDAYKLALSTRGRQLSGRFLEQQKSMSDSKRASEDLKLLLSQISAARGIDLLLHDMSPRVSANSEEFFRAMDGSGAIGMHMIQRRISLERNESSLSLDGSTISEIEGESLVDRLRRQVEHDKKIKRSLYKELEEERNASAIAANQAMAMITKLQEEKSALYMEALQYLRMMEEQAEYDGDALQKANDLLTEKEKQIQEFEYELELYRNQLEDVSFSNTFDKLIPEPEKTQKLDANYGGSNKTSTRDSETDKHDIVNRVDGAPKMFDGEIDTVRSSLRLFEDDKQYVLHCIKKLENKLSFFIQHEVNTDMIDGAFSTQEALEANASEKLECTGVSQENGKMEKNHLRRDAPMCNETPLKDLSGNENTWNDNEEYGKFRSSQNVKDGELDAFRHELSVLNNRLEALEAEQNVIECSFNSLEKGNEGFEFIREIIARLQELHSAHIRTGNENLTSMSQ